MTLELADCDTHFYCGMCLEEYVLPEASEECPVCLQQDMVAV